MGVYTGLQEVAESVAAFLRTHSGLTTARYGHPITDPTGATEAVRLTLLWVTPQPTHRNDPSYRNSVGAIALPPLTLSAFFMVTTYGGGEVDPASAYQLLGTVLRVFHEEPILTLPINGAGEGEVTVTHVPTAADLMEKVFTPLQLRHRPFAIFEVAPVQILPLAVPTADAPPVRPGGIHLDVTAAPPPSIVRITPDRQVPGGVVRVELALGGGSLGAFAIGGAAASSSPLAGTTSWRVTLPSSVAGEAAPIAAQLAPVPSGRWTDRHVIGVLPASAATVDTPLTATVSITGSLSLTARGVLGATEAWVWPDAGVPGESDVRRLVIVTTASSVQILGTELDAKLSGSPSQRSLMNLLLRLAIRLPSGSFTPYVLIEVTP
ncbi:MAG: Pvc16 family protein [Kofleriaceae bacterium]